jgi:hypothetical protein
MARTGTVGDSLYEERKQVGEIGKKWIISGFTGKTAPGTVPTSMRIASLPARLTAPVQYRG